jgi:hypothetical protein
VSVCRSAALPPDQLFSDGQGEIPLLDLEGLQFEGAVEGEPRGGGRWEKPHTSCVFVGGGG